MEDNRRTTEGQMVRMCCKLFLYKTRSVIRVRLLFHIDFFEISIILRIPKIPKEKKLSYIIFIIFHAKKY